MATHGKFQDPRFRLRFLEILRETGVIDDAVKLVGTTKVTLKTYRDANPEFEQAVQDAVQYYTVQQELEYGHEARKHAAEYWKHLCKTRTVKQELLYKFLFERDKRLLS